MSFSNIYSATAVTADRSNIRTDLRSKTSTITGNRNIHRYYFIITTTTTIVVCGTCCLYQFIIWRARKRSRTIVQQIMDSIQKEDGPLVRIMITIKVSLPLFSIFLTDQRFSSKHNNQTRLIITIPSSVIELLPHP
jgi:hypothetical protein